MDFKLIKHDDNVKKILEETHAHELPWDFAVKERGVFVPYKVVEIPGYKHTEGGKWGENQYWCYPRDLEPTFENTFQFNSNEVCLFGIQANPVTNYRFKWDDREVDSGWEFVITRNGEQFHSFFYRKLEEGILKAQWLLVEMQDSPLCIHEYNWQQKWINKPVWFRNDPARIKSFATNKFEVFLVPDGINKFTCPEHWKQNEVFPEDVWIDYEDGLWVDCLNKDIYWFREEKESDTNKVLTSIK